MSISRNSITLINPDEGDGATARQTKIDFMGFNNGEADINDVLSGVGATSQSTGSGLNDITFAGPYVGTTAVTYYVKIDATGTPDTFSWSKDNFSSTEATGVSLTGSAQTLDSGVTITAGATTGHTLNDVWQMTTIVDISDPHILAQILVDHEGTSADDKGEIFIKVNDGDDGQSPSKTALQVHSNGAMTTSNDLLTSATGAIQMPVGTTAQRNAVQGAIRYNTEQSQFEGYSGSSWAGLGGLIDVDQDTKITAESSAGSDEDVLTGTAGGTTTFTSNSTLFFSNQNIAAKTSSGAALTLQNSDTAIGIGDVLGTINFQAPDESSGGQGIAVAASIEAIATAEFGSAGSGTELKFITSAEGGGAGDVLNATMHPNAAVTFAGTVIESSARELKQDIQPLTGSLDKIMAMQGVSFKWKDKEHLGTDIGMVADEVSQVIPELVSYQNDEPNGIK